MPWDTLVISVILYIAVPVIVAQILRSTHSLDGKGEGALNAILKMIQPYSLVALLATLVLLFGFQGEQIVAQPLIIALLALLILIQVYFNSGLAYVLNRVSGEQHCVAGPSALIGASNFFELAVAAAISLFGNLHVGCSACYGCRRSYRSARHAVSRMDRQSQQWLVRARPRCER